MSAARVALVLRVDGIFNLIAGLVLQFYIKPVMAIIGWPETNTPIYTAVLGSALIGLSLAVIFVSNRPQQARSTILASIIAKLLAGISIAHTAFILRTPLPQPVMLLAAVAAQVLFVLGEAAYLLSAGKRADSVAMTQKA